MPLREYLCPEGHAWEALRPLMDEVRALPCPEHGLFSDRQASGAVQLNPPTGAALRSHFSLFREASQEIDHAYTKAGVEAPPLAKIAQAKARAIIAAGEAPTPRPFE